MQSSKLHSLSIISGAIDLISQYFLDIFANNSVTNNDVGSFARQIIDKMSTQQRINVTYDRHNQT